MAGPLTRIWQRAQANEACFCSVGWGRFLFFWFRACSPLFQRFMVIERVFSHRLPGQQHQSEEYMNCPSRHVMSAVWGSRRIFLAIQARCSRFFREQPLAASIVKASTSCQEQHATGNASRFVDIELAFQSLVSAFQVSTPLSPPIATPLSPPIAQPCCCPPAFAGTALPKLAQGSLKRKPVFPGPPYRFHVCFGVCVYSLRVSVVFVCHSLSVSLHLCANKSMTCLHFGHPILSSSAKWEAAPAPAAKP